MATKFQIKRTSVSGRTPNTTNSGNSSYIAAGELALNLTDEKLYSSNGTVAFEVGANLANITVAGNAALGKIVANGSLGTAGQALFSNSTGGLYWDTGSAGITVELVNSTSNVTTLTTISTLQFDENSGFNVVNVASGTAKVEINSTFKFWQVDGVQKLTATGLDTVNFIAGNNITITANGANTPQSIAFSTSLTPTFTSATFGNSTVNTAVNSTSIAVTKVIANGSAGNPGQVLTSNGTGVYWTYKSTPSITLNTFTGDDTTVNFKLSTDVEVEKTFVFLNGVIQKPTVDYTISNGILTFATAPVTGESVHVRILGVENFGDAEFITNDYLGNGSNTVYTLSTSQSSNNFSFVFLNGICQVPGTDYSISGSTLTFTVAPPNNEKIRVTSINLFDDFVTTTYTANGTATQFALPHNTSAKKMFVSLNGLTQAPITDFTVSGNTVTFVTAPAANDTVIIRSFAESDDSAGSNTTIQYNKSGVLGGSLGFTFNETTNNVVIGNTLTVPNFILNASNPPANSTATGSTGTFAWDSSYFYIATGTNTWKKVPISVDGTVGAATAGSNTNVQFNDSGTLGATAGFTFDKATNNATIANTLTVGKISANGSTGSNGQVLVSNGSGIYWGASSGAGSGVGITRQILAGNGSNTVFTLSEEPINEDHLMVYVDRVLQRDPDYSFSGTTLTFATAPDNGSDIDIYIMTSAAQAVRGVTRNTYTGNGSNTIFTMGASSSNAVYTLVFVDTVFQPTSEYTISGQTITFTTAPDNGVPIEVVQLGVGTVGDPQVAGSNNEIQYHSSNSFAANNKFTFNPSTTTLALGSNVTINTSTIFIGNSSVNTTITAGNVHLQGTQLTVGNVVLTGGQLSIGNVTITDTQITVGNSTVNTVLGSTGSLSGNGSQLTSVNAIALQGNSVNDILLAANTAANTLASAAFSNAATRADNAYSNATTYASNADNISTGTLNTARLPATVNVSTAINVGANVNINTSTIFIGNSTVNTTIAAGNINLQGTQLTVGNVTVTGDSYTIGNSTVNTTISGGSITINGVNVNTAITSNAATAYSNATSYADTKAGQAFTNAASRADSAYSNAVAYAASNSYVNTTFLPFTGGTLTGNLTVNATANIVSNLAANNATFRGDVQIDGNLTVSGTSVVINATSLAVEDNMIYLNNGSQVSHPDLGFAGNYNDGSYKHAGFFRDATDGVWKVFDGYTPEPDASAYIDTSNVTFRIAHFTANAITGNTFTGNGAALTSINATSISSGTLDTARLPATANITTAINVGANVTANTTTMFIGNSTVNTNISAATILINGVNVNTAITSNAATAYSNAIAYSGNAALAYSNATSYASNASNISSGTIGFARLPALYLGTTQIQSSSAAQAVSGITTLAAGNTTVTGSISATDNDRFNFKAQRIPIEGSPQNGTHKGYILLAKAYTSGQVAPSYVIGKIIMRRGAVSAGHNLDVYEVLSSTGYQSESFTVNRIGAGGDGSAFLRLVKVTYGGVVYHAIESSNNGGEPTQEMNFIGSIVDSPLKMTDGSYVSNVTAFGNLVTSIDNNGNVGVGSHTPLSKLHVTSSLNTYAGSGLLLGSAGVASGYIWTTDNLYIKPNSTQGTATGSVNIQNYSGVTGIQLDPSTSNAFCVAANGNVGVNTGAPAAKLNILVGAGGANGTVGLRIGGTDNYASLELGITGGYDGMITSYGNDIRYYAGHWRTIGSVASENHSHYWHTSKIGSTNWDTAKMALNHEGYLGIGASSPYATIHIVGDSNANGSAWISSTKGGSVSHIHHGTYGDWYIRSAHANTGKVMIQDSGPGLVGIGTGSPSSKLHIVTDSADTSGNILETTGSSGKTFFAVHKLGFIRIRSSDTNGAAMHMYDNAGTKRAEFGVGSDNKLNWYSDALTSNWLTFDGGNGRVGIGTTSPAQKLDVVGTIRTAADANTGTIIFGSDGTDIKIFRDNSYDFVIQQNASSGNPLYLAGAGDVRVSIDCNNNSTGNKFVVGNDAVKSSNDLFYVNESGNAWLSGTLTEASSVALKKNINPIENALDFISRLAGVTYDRKDGTADNRAGLIAEEVEQVLPNLVMKDKEGNPSGIQYTNLIAYLVESIKELKAEIDILKSK